VLTANRVIALGGSETGKTHLTIAIARSYIWSGSRGRFDRLSQI
jgi:DNA replication protein DnaC